MSGSQLSLDPVRQADQERAEQQIREQARDVDYAIREYPIEVLVSKYLDGEETGENEIFIPDYQRHFVWDLLRQSRFIESVMIGLPIPYLFVADVRSDEEELSGRLEIVDGTQRIRTLAAYLTDNLRLGQLEKLPLLNGTAFSDLLPSRQRRFRRVTIRLIELTEHADEETRRDMFDRINSGGERLRPMETRRGVREGPFLHFVEELARDQRFRRLAPLSPASIKRRDYDELVVRFFAYADNYNNFERSVIDFVNEYIDSQEGFDPATDGARMRAEWDRVMEFVEQNFSYGFRKGPNNNRTPRVRFEAIAVGTALALRENPGLSPNPREITSWAYGSEFNNLVASDGANSRPRLVARIEYVRDKLLGRA
jgi:hypothetical protein